MAIEVLSHFFKPATVLRNHLSKYEETSVAGLEDVSSFTLPNQPNVAQDSFIFRGSQCMLHLYKDSRIQLPALSPTECIRIPCMLTAS